MITDDGSGALRVRRYFVYQSFAGVNRSIYHSSEHAKLTDAEYVQMIADAIKATGELKDGADQELKEKQALV